MCNQYTVKTLVKTLPPFDESKYEPMPEVEIEPLNEDEAEVEIEP
jgi:hypothetical protein